MRKSLTKNQILRLKTDIDNTFKAGKRVSRSCFKLYVAKNNLSFNRLIVIPVRHYGNSIQRNTIRRQVKEIFRTNQDKLKTGYDFAFVVYPGKSLSYEEKKQTIITLYEQAEVLEASV